MLKEGKWKPIKDIEHRSEQNKLKMIHAVAMIKKIKRPKETKEVKQVAVKEGKENILMMKSSSVSHMIKKKEAIGRPLTSRPGTLVERL